MKGNFKMNKVYIAGRCEYDDFLKEYNKKKG